MQKHFTIATFNLFNFIEPPQAFYAFDNIYSNIEWRKKCDWTTNQLNTVNADIIGFQEVFSPRPLEQICRGCELIHFATVDRPSVESDYINIKPVVAFASKYPIVQCQGLVVDNATRQALGLSTTFQYSRMPIHALVEVPIFGLTDIIIVHLKSQRPVDSDTDGNGYSRYSNELIGSIKSSQQRNEEALALRYQLRKIRSKFLRPIILMGDMNQTLINPSIQCLVEPKLNTLTHIEKEKLFLSDSWQFSSSQTQRVPSYYYGEQGSILDYILLSQEFSTLSIQHKTFDKHLVEPNYHEDSMSSDHGIVVTEINAFN